MILINCWLAVFRRVFPILSRLHQNTLRLTLNFQTTHYMLLHTYASLLTETYTPSNPAH